MNGRRGLIAVVIGGIIVSYGWCILMSGVFGWIMGYDMGQREARVAMLPTSGVLVTRVERGSPAELAGLTSGDTIIAVNGVPVEDVLMLQEEMQRYAPGEEIQLTYQHNLREHVTTVTLGQFPNLTQAMPYLGVYYTARAENPADL
ncbi:MAG: PDZ domain-containing protein [Chloroflexaceae bacterium]|nr:PDZ domain-containing protein [Chloroflexaceae bacterium]